MQHLKIAGRLLRQISVHFRRHACAQAATALSYQTLLALVPLAAIAMAMLTWFPAFKEMQDTAVGFLFDNFLPTKMSGAYTFIENFAENAANLTIIGLLGLAITATMLLSSIEKQFSRIWHVQKSRHLWKRLMVYILIVLIGPVAVASSLTLMTWVVDYTEKATGLPISGMWGFAVLVIPYLLLPATFMLLYKIVPACPVRWRDALGGAVTAAILFNLGKACFGLYLNAFPTFEIIYGALAALPVFLIWLYVSWAIALLGAVITAVLGHAGAKKTPAGAGRPSQRA